VAISDLIEAFHDACAEAIRKCDGLPDLIMGDAGAATLNFLIVQGAG
jgi:hypothetical protein